MYSYNVIQENCTTLNSTSYLTINRKPSQISFLILFQIIALGLIIYGAFSAYLIFISNSEEVMKSFGTAIPALLMMAFGLLLLIFVFVGCCGLCRESTCCMETVSRQYNKHTQREKFTNDMIRYNYSKIIFFATEHKHDCCCS